MRIVIFGLSANIIFALLHTTIYCCLGSSSIVLDQHDPHIFGQIGIFSRLFFHSGHLKKRRSGKVGERWQIQFLMVRGLKWRGTSITPDIVRGML